MTIENASFIERVLQYSRDLKKAAEHYMATANKDVPYYDKAMARQPFDKLLAPSDLTLMIDLLHAQNTELEQYRSAAKTAVAWTDSEELRDAGKSGCGYLFPIGGTANKFADPRRQVMLYQGPSIPTPELPIYQLRDWHWYDAEKRIYEEVTEAGGEGRIVYAAPPAPPPALPVYQYRIRNGYNGQASAWQTINRDQVDFVLKAQPINAEFQIISAAEYAAEEKQND